MKSTTSKRLITVILITATVCLCLTAVSLFIIKKDKTPENIIFSDNPDITNNNEAEAGHITIDDNLLGLLESGGDDDLFAFVLTSTNEYTFTDSQTEKLNELSKECSRLEEKLSEVALSCADNLVNESGISYTEAWSKIYGETEFISAREDYIRVKTEYKTYRMNEIFNIKADEVEYFVSNGFKVICYATDRDYSAYLSNYHNALGIFAGTKEQILAIGNQRGNYTLFAAAENADKYIYSDNYSSFEYEMHNGSKLSKALVNAFETSKDCALEVKVFMGYFGKEYTVEEVDALAYDAIGMTEQEYFQHGTTETVEKFIEERNKLLWHTDYYESVARKYLNDSEYIELNAYSGCVKAKITYEKAVELCKNNDIAYILLNNETPNLYTDTSIGFDAVE